MLNQEMSDSDDDSSNDNDESMSLNTTDKNNTFSSFTVKPPTTGIQSKLPISPTGLTDQQRADQEFNERLEQIIEERANHISEIVANAILGEPSVSHTLSATG